MGEIGRRDVLKLSARLPVGLALAAGLLAGAPTPPKTIKLRFGGGVEPAYSKLTIETPDGKVLAQGAVGKPDSPRELSLDAPDLPPARYIVRYRVLSTDGHIVEGNYEFTVDGK